MDTSSGSGSCTDSEFKFEQTDSDISDVDTVMTEIIDAKSGLQTLTIYDMLNQIIFKHTGSASVLFQEFVDQKGHLIEFEKDEFDALKLLIATNAGVCWFNYFIQQLQKTDDVGDLVDTYTLQDFYETA